jgi:hypothetical protein
LGLEALDLLNTKVDRTKKEKRRVQKELPPTADVVNDVTSIE